MTTMVPDDSSGPPPIPNNSADPTTTSSTPSTSNGGSSTNAKPKLKRFRFIDAYDLYLLKVVRCVDAHLPEWGTTESLYDEVLKLFLRAFPLAVFVHSQKPSAKTLTDRFKRLVARRREDVKNTSKASGIVEVHGEKEVLLDDLIMEMDEKEEAARAEKALQTENEKRLVSAGENIRGMALKRKKSDSDNTEVEGNNAGSGKKRRMRRLETAQSDDEITASMLQQADDRRGMETSRLKLEQERVELERKKAEKEAERFEMMQESTNRRLDLDDKRFELEKEERKQSLVERKKMLDVMEMLCKKLE